MTGVGMCKVFIPDRFKQAGRGANGKVSDWLGVGMLWRGGEVYWVLCYYFAKTAIQFYVLMIFFSIRNQHTSCLKLASPCIIIQFK
jgi:hypothetical protein